MQPKDDSHARSLAERQAKVDARANARITPDTIIRVRKRPKHGRAADDARRAERKEEDKIHSAFWSKSSFSRKPYRVGGNTPSGIRRGWRW